MINCGYSEKNLPKYYYKKKQKQFDFNLLIGLLFIFIIIPIIALIILDFKNGKIK